MKIFNGTPSKYTSQLKSSMDAAIEWTEDVDEKENCDAVLYVATPDLEGINHIIDVVNDSNHWKEKTMFFSTMEETPIDFGANFTSHQIKSLVATGKMVRINGGQWFESENEMKQYLKKLHAING